jgi:hypothetical protein
VNKDLSAGMVSLAVAVFKGSHKSCWLNRQSLGGIDQHARFDDHVRPVRRLFQQQRSQLRDDRPFFTGKRSNHRAAAMAGTLLGLAADGLFYPALVGILIFRLRPSTSTSPKKTRHDREKKEKAGGPNVPTHR